LKREDAQAVEQIQPKSTGVHLSPQVAVRCGHDADVHVPRGALADPLKLTFLQHAQ
jgi:hypothetical protein